MKEKNVNQNNTNSLREMISNTKENMKEAEISMEFAGEEELENLQEKNAHRKTAIHQMKEQLKEEQQEIVKKK